MLLQKYTFDGLFDNVNGSCLGQGLIQPKTQSNPYTIHLQFGGLYCVSNIKSCDRITAPG